MPRVNDLVKQIGYLDYAIWSYTIVLRLRHPSESGYLNAAWMYKNVGEAYERRL